MAFFENMPWMQTAMHASGRCIHCGKERTLYVPCPATNCEDGICFDDENDGVASTCTVCAGAGSWFACETPGCKGVGGQQ